MEKKENETKMNTCKITSYKLIDNLEITTTLGYIKYGEYDSWHKFLKK
jgi:hypothetical protein